MNTFDLSIIPMLLDIAFVVIALIFVILGIWRGFIKSIIRSAKLILAVVAAFFLGSYLGLVFKDAFVDNMVYTPVHSWIDSAYGTAVENIDVDEILSTVPQYALTDEIRENIIKATEESSGDELVETVSHAIADPVATGIANVFGYIAVFILAIILLSILAWLLTKLTDKLVILGVVNRLLGGVWGALTAVAFLVVLASIIKLFWSHDSVYLDTVIVKFIGESGILDALAFLNVGNLI